ncbi:MAG: hypothetical protein Kow0059_16290 [Candidatus Sumerlaeia bacterium]
MSAITLSAIFSDHAVLQREAPVPVWGTAEPGARVAVTLGGQTQTARAGADGHWRVTLEPMPAGGPYSLVASGGGTCVRREDVFVGEVWVCGGQSNMQRSNAESADAEAQSAAASAYPRLRFFTVPRGGSDEPQADFAGPAAWELCTSNTVPGFSSLAWHFGRELHETERLGGVMIGLVDCSFGGTRVEAWMSRAWLEAHFPGEPLRDSIFGFKPTAMFNAMVSPLAPYAGRGVLWYQGESNTPHPEQYGRLLPGMIAEWRERWERPDWPFFLVQLPNWAERIEGLHFTWIREQQARVAAADPNVHLAVTIDAGDSYDLHPKDKRPIAHRLALLARAKVYGEQVACDGPVYRGHEVAGGGVVRVRFDHTAGGLVNANAPGPLRGFALAGADGVFYYAEAAIEGEQVVLRHGEVPEPRFMRYAWEGDPQADLRNTAGLPAAPFRTDDFPPDGLELYRVPVSRTFWTPAYSVLIDGGACVPSVTVGGLEFFDGTSPAAPGAFFHTVWGPTRLHHIRALGPRLLWAELETASIRFAFGAETMEWTLTNRLSMQTSYFIVFSAKIEAGRAAGPGGEGLRAWPPNKDTPFDRLTVERGGAALEIECAGGVLVPQFSADVPRPAAKWVFAPGEKRILRFRLRPAASGVK